MKLAVDRRLFAQWQWQPTTGSHDPNPPITVEDTAVPTQYGFATAFTPAIGRLNAVRFYGTAGWGPFEAPLPVQTPSALGYGPSFLPQVGRPSTTRLFGLFAFSPKAADVQTPSALGYGPSFLPQVGRPSTTRLFGLSAFVQSPAVSSAFGYSSSFKPQTAITSSARLSGFNTWFAFVPPAQTPSALGYGPSFLPQTGRKVNTKAFTTEYWTPVVISAATPETLAFAPSFLPQLAQHLGRGVLDGFKWNYSLLTTPVATVYFVPSPAFPVITVKPIRIYRGFQDSVTKDPSTLRGTIRPKEYGYRTYKKINGMPVRSYKNSARR